MLALYATCFARAQDCDASFGTDIAVKDCHVAMEDFAAMSVRDEAWTRSPVLRSFNRDRVVSTPRNLMPQGFPFKTCAVGVDLAGSSGQPVVDSYKNLLGNINELVQACVVGDDSSRHRGFGGRMKVGGMVYVVTNPIIEATQNTCLAVPRQYARDLGECIAQRARSPTPMSANTTWGSNASLQSGYSTRPNIQGLDQGARQSPNGREGPSAQQHSQATLGEQIHPAFQAAAREPTRQQRIETPTLLEIQATYPDLYARIQQEVARAESHAQVGRESLVEEQLALQRLAQRERERQRFIQPQPYQQQAQQQVQQQAQQRAQQQLAEQQFRQRQMFQQQLNQQELLIQQAIQQRLSQQRLVGEQSLAQRPANEQQLVQEDQRLRQLSASPPWRPSPQGYQLRRRPGSDDSDDTSLLGPANQGPIRLPVGPANQGPILPPLRQPPPYNLATQLNATLGNAMQFPTNGAGPSEAQLERPAQRQRLENQSPASGASISNSEFGRMLQDFSVAGDSSGSMRGLTLPSFAGLAPNADEPDPNEVNQNPPQQAVSIGKPPRPGRRRKAPAKTPGKAPGKPTS